MAFVDQADLASTAPGKGADMVGFQQPGGTPRTAGEKLNDTVGVTDFGAVGDGTTQNLSEFESAAAAMTNGGSLDIPGGTFLVRENLFGPSRGNVHAFDYADIGTNNILLNSSFTGSPATGWTLSNFTSTNPGISHLGGSIASAKRSITVSKYSSYLIRVTVNTTARGGVSCYLGDQNLFTGDEVSVLPVGTATYEFALFSYEKENAVDFELRSDAVWAGSVSSLELIQVEREAPYDLFSLAADRKRFDVPFGIKFGRFLSGNMAIGDRLTSGLLTHDAAWNVAFGSRALSTNTSQFENVAVGCFSLEYNQVDRNTALGYSAMRYNTKGIQNTALGYKTFGANSTGSNNTGVGFWASLYNKTGGNNTSVGFEANYYNEFGEYNSAFGSQAGVQNDGGSGNTYIGAISGPYTPGASTFSYSFSTCVGAESKGYGSNTTAIGCQARCGSDPNTGGTAIVNAATAVGFAAVAHDEGVAVGGQAETSDIRSVAVGHNARALASNSVCVGFLTTAGESGTAIGSQSGINLSGLGNTSIGYGANAFASPTSLINATAVGYGAVCNGDNQVTLGNDSTAQMRTAGYVAANYNDAIPAGGNPGVALKATSAADFGIFFGVGAPLLSAAKGSLYLRSDGSGTNDRAYVNVDGGADWTALITAA